MTTSLRITCTGNTECDQVKFHVGYGKASQVGGGTPMVLERGETSPPISAGSGEHGRVWIRIEGKHGDGPYLGDVAVIAKERTDEVRR